MQTFNIYYGIGGGYNVVNREEIEAENKDEAEEVAYQLAVETFESYGVFERHNDVDEYENEEEYEMAFWEEVERWVKHGIVE